MIRSRTAIVSISMVLALASCSGTGEPESPVLSPTTTTTTNSPVPLDPAQYLQTLGVTFQVNNLRSCVAPVREQACAKELDGAGKAAEALREFVTADPGIPAEERDKTIKSVDTLVRAVNLLRKGGCYGMSTPPTPDPNFLMLCDSLASGATVSWLGLTGDTGRR
jgi:hypothetical protein